MSAAPEPVTGALWRLGVADVVSAYRSSTLDPETLLDVLLARIARLDPALNTMVAIDAAGARAAARDSAARWRAGAPLSPIDGVPLTIKDNLLMRGLPATWGSRAYADFHPEADEAPVARLRAAGAVLLGKTNVPELTLEGYTSNLLFGTTRNPWDPALTPGGSSGGAAAGVAAGLVPAAVGTDGGGSIRRPASHTGLVGFKPSVGRVPRAGGFPETLHDFEVVGTLTRSVADAALLDAVLSGDAARPLPARAQRILSVPRFDDAPLDPEVAAACDTAAAALEAAGHIVETGPVATLFHHPAHPYTQALLDAAPVSHPSMRDRQPASLAEPADLRSRQTGCPFAARCPHSIDACSDVLPPLRTVGHDHQAACIRSEIFR